MILERGCFRYYIYDTTIIYIYYHTMILEIRDEVLKQLKTNYALVRDEDGEVLCLLWRDDNWYYALFMEHYNLTKDNVDELLNKCSWLAFIPVVDEKAREQYKKELAKAEAITREQVDKL